MYIICIFKPKSFVKLLGHISFGLLFRQVSTELRVMALD